MLKLARENACSGRQNSVDNIRQTRPLYRAENNFHSTGNVSMDSDWLKKIFREWSVRNMSFTSAVVNHTLSVHY